MSTEDNFFSWINDNVIYFGNISTGDDERQEGSVFIRETGSDEFRLCYTGQFLRGKRSGFGINYYYYPNVYYSGSFVNDKRHGTGTMVFSNGAIYHGDFFEDSRAGRGSMLYADGSFYHGYWLASKREGDGTMTYSNGDFYEGRFHQDQIHGHGTYVTRTGIVVVGVWQHSRLVRDQFYTFSLPSETSVTTWNHPE